MKNPISLCFGRNRVKTDDARSVPVAGALFRRARRQRVRNLREHGAVPALRDDGAVGDAGRRRGSVGVAAAQSQHVLHGRRHAPARGRQTLPARHRTDALLGAAAQQDLLRTDPDGRRSRVPLVTA